VLSFNALVGHFGKVAFQATLDLTEAEIGPQLGNPHIMEFIGQLRLSQDLRQHLQVRHPVRIGIGEQSESLQNFLDVHGIHAPIIGFLS